MCNTKTLILVVLVVLIISVVVSLVKMNFQEKFQGNPYSMEKVHKLLDGVLNLDAKDTNVRNMNTDNSQKLDLIESHMHMLKKTALGSKMRAADEAKKEYLILKCSPNSSVATFENAPEVQSQADTNRQILQEIYKELDSLS